MNYRKNPDNTYTAFKLMSFDGQMLEATAHDLDMAKAMLKEEIKAWKTYKLEEVGYFFSKGCENQKGVVYCREDLVDIIKKDNS